MTKISHLQFYSKTACRLKVFSGWMDVKSQIEVPDVASQVCWFADLLLGPGYAWGRGGALARWPGTGPRSWLGGRRVGRSLPWWRGRLGRGALPRVRVASLSPILRAEGGAVWLVCMRQRDKVRVVPRITKKIWRHDLFLRSSRRRKDMKIKI